MNQMQSKSNEMSRYHYYSLKWASEVFGGVLMNDRENIRFVWFKISKFSGFVIFSMKISRRMAWMNLTFWLNDQSVIHSCSGLMKQKTGEWTVSGSMDVFACMLIYFSLVCKELFSKMLQWAHIRCKTNELRNKRQKQISWQKCRTNWADIVL